MVQTLKMLAIVMVAALCISQQGCGGSDGSDSPTVPSSTTATKDTLTLPSIGAATSTMSAFGREVQAISKDPGGSGGYIFDPSEYSFRLGETVTFILSGETEYHTFVVDELEIDEEFDPGEIIRLTYTFDKPGTFRVYCIPHETLGMVGTITVR